MSIAKLLAAQKVDKERLTLEQSLEKGKVKVELDKATQTINESKKKLLQLDADAKTLQESFNKIQKLVTETLAAVEKANQAQSKNMDEYGEYLSKLSRLEGQLADIERRISEKTAAFKSTTLSVIKATDFVKKNSPLYLAQQKEVLAKTKALDQEFAAMTKDIDEKLLTKYKAIRKDKAGDVKDVVVQLTADHRCQGCYMNMPVATISKIKANGWTICEECGRIIYQNAQ